VTQINPLEVDVQVATGLPAWRPWRALTQAEYNALQASGAWDRSTLYVVTPQRVMNGGSEVWPGPWDGGIVTVNQGQTVVANPVLDIAISTAGNLLVLVFNRGTNYGPTGVTDNLGQPWKQAWPGPTNSGLAANVRGVGMWYCEGSASVNQVHVTAAAAPGFYRVFELSGIVESDALDAATGVTGVTSGGVTPSSRCYVLCTHMAATANPPPSQTNLPDSPPWTNFGQIPMADIASPSLVNDAGGVFEGGQPAIATWQPYTGMAIAAAFRTVTT
jgi:hypothetical protein